MKKDQHILITGANGFVGRHLSKVLLAEGHSVSLIFRSDPIGSRSPVGRYQLDLADRAAVADLFAKLKPTRVVHLASAKYRGSDPARSQRAYEEDLALSFNVIDACRGVVNFQRFIFLGSCDEYGRVQAPYSEFQNEMPSSTYGASKLAVTQRLLALCNDCQFPALVLRPTVIYGPGQRDEMFVSALMRSLAADQYFDTTPGEQTRDFVFIDDVVGAIAKALTTDNCNNGKIFNIGSGEPITIKAAALMIADMIGPTAKDLLRFGALPYRPNEVMDYAACIDRARTHLDWYPKIDLRDGLLRTIQSFKAMLNESSNLAHE